jgi:energy-converting hydrogenase Eha subunit C
MLSNISSSLNTIIAVVVAYIIVVCTVRPLQNLVMFALEMTGALEVGSIVIFTTLLIAALQFPFIAFAL